MKCIECDRTLLLLSDCGDIMVSNGTVYTPEGTTLGSLAFVNCNSGYVLVGDSFLTCLDGPVWSAVPECVRGTCYILSSVYSNK